MLMVDTNHIMRTFENEFHIKPHSLMARVYVDSPVFKSSQDTSNYQHVRRPRVKMFGEMRL